jgi:hypothetical protein
MGYLTKMNGESGQNGFSAVGFSILGQPPSAQSMLSWWVELCSGLQSAIGNCGLKSALQYPSLQH